MCCLSEHTVAGLLVPLADRASEICILARGALSSAADAALAMRAELVKMFSTREEIDGEREPRVSR